MSAEVESLRKENAELKRKLTIAEKRIEDPDICEHGNLHCVDCEERCMCCGGDHEANMATRHGQRLCEDCTSAHDDDDFGCCDPVVTTNDG